MKKILTTIIYFILFFASAKEYQAQKIDYEHLPSGLSKYNSEFTDTLQPAEKNYWLPAVEVIGLNFGVWGYHKYLSGEGWSNISWESIKNNFRNGFEWDADGYLINQFWHPYHGSNYFNTARSNGLSFWEAAPYAFGGSLMWEYFMEIEPPSYNDIVNTPITGIILGEISYRVSDLIIDESSSGFERFAREFSATLLNPMRGLNRILHGDMWKSGIKKENPDFNFTASAGLHNLFFSRKISDSRTYASVGLNLNYGNLFDVAAHKKPFDYFSVRTELHFTDKDNIAGIFASGVVTDNKINLFGSNENIAGIYKEIDIHINTVYKLSATSVSGQIINRAEISKSIEAQNYIGLSAILMGGTNSNYASEYGKDYNLGPGGSAKIGTKIIFEDLGEVYVNYKRYWIHTLSGAQGEEFVGLLNAGVNYQLSDTKFLGLDFILYERTGYYKYFADTQNSNSALRFYLRFAI